MRGDKTPVDIRSRVFWFKIIDFLQQNWALIDESPEGCTVFFLGDDSGVFDRLSFASATEAESALRRDGFSRLEDDEEAQDIITAPVAPFHEGEHPNGRIYSSGRFWR